MWKPSQMIEDTLLLLRFRSGSREALCAIYLKYSKVLLKITVGLCGDAATAEDAVHDVFLRFAEDPARVSVGGNLKSYLVKCAVNRLRNIVKQRRHRQGQAIDAEEAFESGADRPEEWIIRDETIRRLAEVLSVLPYDQREVILLHIDGGMRFREIAASTGVSINTVQSRYRYGLEKLRELLKNEVQE